MFLTSVKLCLVALIPAGISVLLYLLKKKTSFNKLSPIIQQIIIGLCFGVVSVCGTLFGVKVDGATTNVRDAAPLCAGLIFGGPAAIISGVIGGAFRWIVAPWAGMYTRLACSLSTVIAGVYATIIRKYIFKDMRPSADLGLIAATIMEILHLLLIFLSHTGEAYTTIKMIGDGALPMILSNSVAVLLALLFVNICNNNSVKLGLKVEKIFQLYKS